MWLRHWFYRIEKWLPADWPELDESLMRQATAKLAVVGQADSGQANTLETGASYGQTRVDLLRAACCLFWRLFYWPERYATEQLAQLKEIWRYDYQPDEDLDWTRAYVSTHITAAFALRLFETETGFSEALREAVQEITRLASYLKAKDSLTEPGVFYVNEPDYFNETVPLRRSLPIACSLAWCFNFYIARDTGDVVAAFNSAFEAFDTADVCNRVHRFSEEPTAAIEQPDISLQLVAMWMRCPDIAEVFDQIHQLPEPQVDWAELAFRCEQMRFYHEKALECSKDNRFLVEPMVKSEVGKFRTDSGHEWAPYYPLSEFWTFARGLCITRLSPDAYRKLRDDDERHAAESRLRRYFFGESWADLPQESRDALITADRVYWATEGRRGDILENLRLAVEPITEQRLAVPFRAWRSQLERPAGNNSQPTRQEVFLPISRLIHELWDDRPLFAKFARSVFPDVSANFWSDVRESLYRLRNVRSAATHPEDGEPPAYDEIMEQYRRFVGIGQRGILLDLLALRPQWTDASLA